MSAAGVMLSVAAARTSEPAAAIACTVSMCLSERLRTATSDVSAFNYFERGTQN